MARTIRIGTRSSNLAMWQANLVASILKDNGVESEIIKIDSHGDIDLKQPIYERVNYLLIFLEMLVVGTMWLKVIWV